VASTFRQIVNNVLQNIGEAQIPGTQTAVTDTYQLQICNFVNHIKEECEDMGPWRALWETMNVIQGAGLNQSQIKDSVTNAAPNSRSRLVRMMQPYYGREVGLVFDITSFPTPFPMRERPLAEIIYRNTILFQTTTPYSTDYAIDDVGSDIVNLYTYPPATAQRTYQVTMAIPQPRVDATASGSAVYPWLGTVGLDTPILIPAMPIELGASWYALQERGEELGTSSMFTEERYRRAADDAFSRDQGESGGYELIVT
jgi:hypothetical protein